ncbi:hypothetical protein AOCH_006791, partial [Aspergillus ochraceoroseus]
MAGEYKAALWRETPSLSLSLSLSILTQLNPISISKQASKQAVNQSIESQSIEKQANDMSNPSAPPPSSSSSSSRTQNDFGADLWVRSGTKPHRHPTAGRGLFAGLQDVKHYNVESGWRNGTPTRLQAFLGLCLV